MAVDADEWYVEDYEDVYIPDLYKRVQTSQTPTILHDHGRDEECNMLGCETWYIEDEDTEPPDVLVEYTVGFYLPMQLDENGEPDKAALAEAWAEIAFEWLRDGVTPDADDMEITYG